MPVIDRAGEVVRNIERLIRGCHVLGIPVITTEQYVKGLGGTIEVLKSALVECGGYLPIEKDCFSAVGCEPFTARLEHLARRQVLVVGVETHVCVYQTLADLVRAGYECSIVTDAVSSRTPENRELALRRLEAEGVKLTSTEMALFELLRVSGTAEFKAISRLVK